ncbi:aldose 1-epimerase family protein [Rhodocytophaga rosea]|uniref:Aldose 1-epimerase family protein n=1 Tax=Rhodocytophaga rosea TaxID=2704465 RepID=A0A6C0GSX2_9BACT|nr:aldose 1-epimerase family protein [Rhodocytophaga rosea]QHT71255.1 aldose 1-epimerase family protein [Rhodocytophaga rosea]
MAILENEFLKINIRNKGAELTSLIDKTSGTEHLWQGDPSIWNWHAPNLFPVVGGCLNNQLQIGDKTYPMERHGFARQSEFHVNKSTNEQAIFSLPSSPKTKQVYPYDFDFQIEYTLKEKELSITYRVINTSRERMYFSVGAHPAFNVPFTSSEQYTDYFLEFEHEEKLERHLLSGSGLFNGKTEPIALEGNKLLLTKDLFKQDALVFKNLSSSVITLRSRNHNQFVRVAYSQFPYMGIWAKPGADFLCIEPWLGCADSEGEPVDISRKEAIQQVEAGNVFEKVFTITIGQ